VKEIQIHTLFGAALLSGIVGILLIGHGISIGIVFLWLPFLSAANSVRGMAKYGLGTGNASIGYWGTAVGATSAFITSLCCGSTPLLYAAAVVATSLVIGLATGVLADKVIRMKIPRIELNSAVIAVSTAMITAGFLLIIGSNYCLYPFIYIIITLAVLHPYNASTGAGENQKRTLLLALVEACMTTLAIGIVAMLASGSAMPVSDDVTIVVVSACGLVIAVVAWYRLVKSDIYEIRWTGYSPAEH
jgi:tetrahydromethanopterin S-methyltransferase subunit C